MCYESGRLIRKKIQRRYPSCCGLFSKMKSRDFKSSPSLILMEDSWEKGVPTSMDKKIINVGKVNF
jgi:hypothetical protein